MARILVIEDELGLQKVLDYNLRKAGHEVEVCPSGAAGIAAAKERGADLILLDVMLPDSGGADVCRAVKKTAETRDIAGVFIAAKGGGRGRVGGGGGGGGDYVVKPFS